MKKVTLTLLGTGLLAGTLYASGDHMGNHIHEGKMMNHETSTQMKMMENKVCEAMHTKMHNTKDASKTLKVKNNLSLEMLLKATENSDPYSG